VLLVGLMSGCAPPSAIIAQAPPEWAGWPGPSLAEQAVEQEQVQEAAAPGEVEPRATDFIGHLVASRAAELVGRPLRVTAPRLPDDCTGLVRAAFAGLRLDLMSRAERGDSGVTAMWRFAQAQHALEEWDPARPVMPDFAPGDILFFHDTYDRNRDGLFNDGLTHVAVVEQVLADGTIVYIHRGGTGVSRGRLNLSQPTVRAIPGAVLNDYLRPLSRRSAPVLGSELFAGVARVELLASGPPER
jgi:hypothetical protein